MCIRDRHKQEKIQTEIKIIAEGIGFFSASASIVDFGSTMGHGMRIQISHRVTDQMRTQILHRFRL